MDVIESQLKHKSIRKFTGKDIDDATLEKILKASCHAPTGGNLQNYSIIVTRDSERKNVLSDIHYQSHMVQSAPVVLTFCGDLSRISKWCELKGENVDFFNEWGMYLATADTWLAVQNAILAAESLGLGGCVLGSTFHRSLALIDFFNLPKGVVPIATLPMGYPDEDPTSKPRLPLDIIVHQEKYKFPGDGELLERFEAKIEFLWNNYTKSTTFTKELKEKGVGSLAQLYKKIKFNDEEVKDHCENWRRSINQQIRGM